MLVANKKTRNLLCILVLFSDLAAPASHDVTNAPSYVINTCAHRCLEDTLCNTAILVRAFTFVNRSTCLPRWKHNAMVTSYGNHYISMMTSYNANTSTHHSGTDIQLNALIPNHSRSYLDRTSVWYVQSLHRGRNHTNKE